MKYSIAALAIGIASAIGATMQTSQSRPPDAKTQPTSKPAPNATGNIVKFYMRVEDGSIVPTKPTTGFFIEGIRDGNGLVPTSGVLGGKDSDLCAGPAKAWLEISEGQIPNPAAGRTEMVPFVRGCRVNDKFVPANREVICHVGRAQ